MFNYDATSERNNTNPKILMTYLSSMEPMQVTIRVRVMYSYAKFVNVRDLVVPSGHVQALPTKLLDCDFDMLPFAYHLCATIARRAVHAVRSRDHNSNST